MQERTRSGWGRKEGPSSFGRHWKAHVWLAVLPQIGDAGKKRHRDAAVLFIKWNPLDASLRVSVAFSGPS